MADLTPDEMSFFATGELPDSMAAEAAASAAAAEAPEPEVTATVTAPVPVAPVVEDNKTLFERLYSEEQQRRAGMEAKLAQLEAQLAERSKVAEIIPDEMTDPLGAMMHKLNQVNSQVAELQTKLTQEQQNNLLKQQYDQFTGSVRSLKEAYEKTTPDFKDAYAHVRNIRTEDLRLAGALEADIPKILHQDELQIAQNAIQRGKNPAEEMYNMAKRYGYLPKAPGAPATASGLNAKIAALKAGVEAAKTVQKAGAEGELTLTGLKEASNTDLNNLVQDDSAWARIVGGQASGKDIF